MTRRTASPLRPLLAPLVLLALAGCATTPDVGARSAVDPDPADLVAPADMPAPTPGVVEVAGDVDGYLPLAVQGYEATPAERDRSVGSDPVDADEGFTALCRGEVDLVVAARPPAATETALCRANGLGVAPFRVAAGATVAAVAGGVEAPDCLTAAEVDDAAAGPDDEATLTLVAGSATDREQALALPGLETDWDTAVADFKSQRSWYRTAQGEVTAARAEQRRGVAEDRPPAQRAADDERVRRADAELGRARTAWLGAKSELGRIEPLLAAARRSAEVVADLDTTVGRFGLGFVTAAGPVLQALPVETADGDCVTPDATTVADGSYPLATPVLVAVTDRALARPEVESLLRYLLTDGTGPAEQAGLVALPEGDLTEQVGWLDDDAVPYLGTGAAPERPAQ